MRILHPHQPRDTPAPRTVALPPGAPAPPWADTGPGRQLLQEGAERARRNTVEALAHAALMLTEGRRDHAVALADLTVVGTAAWSLFREAAPSDEDVHRVWDEAEGGALASDIGHAAVDEVLTRAYRVAWQLRHGAVVEPVGWIASVPQLDPPHRDLRHPVTVHARFDVEGRSDAVTWSLMDPANELRPVDAEARAAQRLLPREPVPVVRTGASIVVAVCAGADSPSELLGLATHLQARGHTLLAVDVPPRVEDLDAVSDRVLAALRDADTRTGGWPTSRTAALGGSGAGATAALELAADDGLRCDVSVVWQPTATPRRAPRGPTLVITTSDDPRTGHIAGVLADTPGLVVPLVGDAPLHRTHPGEIAQLVDDFVRSATRGRSGELVLDLDAPVPAPPGPPASGTA